MASLIIAIQTFADTLCPWSYVGKVSMDRAMATFQAQHPDVEFVLSWNPFYLFPEAKVSGESPLPCPPLCSAIVVPWRPPLEHQADGRVTQRLRKG